jgi:NAD(P)-dependent dehydrogenase (short-subunit alcohol dehydrogenase family)
MQSVLITGANKGFGLEVIKVYCRNDWRTFPLIRRQKDAGYLKGKFGENCHPITAEISSDSVIVKISETIKQNGGSLDILINNAGNIVKNRGLESADPDDIIEHFNIHCMGVLRCVKGALPYLEKTISPKIINISSRWGSIANTTRGSGGISGLIYSYKIAKSAQNMLTACLNHELAKKRIIVQSVHPGRLKTSVAPPDADLDPALAAERLYNWIKELDLTVKCACHDLMTGDIVEW